MRALMILAVALAACAPTEDEFVDSCLDRCMHETGSCGRVIAGEGGCSEFCRLEWADARGQSSDCQWYMIYWQDCRAEAPCEALTEHCAAESIKAAAECAL